jgi:hypothetical protein
MREELEDTKGVIRTKGKTKILKNTTQKTYKTSQ